MSRLTKKTRSELSPEQQQQFDRLEKMRSPDRDGQIGGPFDAWIRSPELCHRAVSLGNFIWQRTTLDRGLVELSILVTARFWRSNVEWVSHERMAKEYGISDEVIADIFAESRPRAGSQKELLIYDIATSLHRNHEVEKGLYDQAVATFGEQGLIELIMTVGFYTFVSMTLNTFDIETAEGEPTPFPRE